MTVKSERGRRRYVAFSVSPSMTWERMTRTIPGGRRFKIIQCAEGMAIVRCSPEELPECEAAVKTTDPAADTLRVSGTLRTLRDRYEVLKRSAPPKPSRVKAPSKPSH